MRTIPRIVIAGTHSGCGKTTVASGIMAALTARGLAVQPFKVGPDFIDPSHHTQICGRASCNLDPFMMGEAGCLATFDRATQGADIAVIEGVMGIYDGLDGSDLASTAHVAKILKAPVILVVDTKGMSRSVHALIDGYRMFDPALSFAGVIFNRIGSPRHRQMMEGFSKLPSLGWIPRRDDLVVASRHLGLAMAHESCAFAESGKIMEEYCSIDAIIQAASGAEPLGACIQDPEIPAGFPSVSRMMKRSVFITGIISIACPLPARILFFSARCMTRCQRWMPSIMAGGIRSSTSRSLHHRPVPGI